ncbi:choice-of-anchor P family protein [Kitasatospora sp. NPDC059646]|uniref:choice-of-anchor P family protein n=1 Tax=Kitasatospora sp. NPDC059646 TaxID=3346893 RepID=UPI00369991D8
MTTVSTRRRVLAGAALAAGLFCSTAPAFAALTSPEATAYVVSADALNGAAAVPPQPLSTYPPGGTVTEIGLTVGPFATNSTLTATTAGDPAAGTSSASATVDQLGITFGPTLTAALTGVSATCEATPSGATGNGVIASGTVTVLGVPTTLQANAPVNTGVTVAGLGQLVLNEQSTDANGVLTVNAVHFTLLPALGGANVIVGHVECGGAPPAGTVPMINTKVGVIGGSLAAATVLGTAYLRRRRA